MLVTEHGAQIRAAEAPRYEPTARDARADQVEADERDRRRDALRTMAACIGCALLGLVSVMWSAHTTDARLGWFAVYGGLLVGNGGVLVTLMYAYHRGQRRGDW